MKILNLYAGIGGNRKLWGDSHEITAVELNPEIAAIYQDFFPADKVIVGDAHQYLLDHYKEFDFIWSSPPCQTHSRARFWGFRNNEKTPKKYPDMKLYQEIIFLRHYFDGKWVIENVKPFYDPLIPPDKVMGRHLFWANFYISEFEYREADINKGNRNEWKDLHGLSLDGKKISQRRDQVYRNCVYPPTGKHIFDCAFSGVSQSLFQPEHFEQAELFELSAIEAQGYKLLCG